MKKYCLFLLPLVAVTLCQIASAQISAPQRDSMNDRLANSTNKLEKSHLEMQLYQLLKSDKEQDWLTARRFFYQAKRVNTADSIAKAARVRFPQGQVVRDEKLQDIYNEKDPVQKEKLYEAWVKQFPPEKFGTDRIVYDYARNSVALAYAETDNVKKTLEYANMTETPAWKGEGWADAAEVLRRNGHTEEAEELYKKAIANSYKFMTTNRSDPGAGFAVIGFVGYSNSLVEMLIEQKKYNEALPYIKVAHDNSKTVRANVNSNYSKILMELGKDQEAFDIIQEAVKAGQATSQMKEALKTLWVKVKGSEAGYEEYMASVNKIVAEKIRKDLAKQMINLPAANFTLKDVDGNSVSLSELKGKIVLLDFWATWCGPCKRSFPAMKMALEKFKNDPNVKFLFIHTCEKDEHAADSAKSYITRNKYPFQVLMDLKNSEGVNPVVESYKVQAIPTKFVIDGNGNIRFRFTGAAEGEDAAVEEVVAMIEMAKNAK